jgi:hypothetical protein
MKKKLLLIEKAQSYWQLKYFLCILRFQQPKWKDIWTIISVFRVQRELKRPAFEPQGCPPIRLHPSWFCSGLGCMGGWMNEMISWYIFVGTGDPIAEFVYWMNDAWIDWIVDVLNDELIIWWMEGWISCLTDWSINWLIDIWIN